MSIRRLVEHIVDSLGKLLMDFVRELRFGELIENLATVS
jgi:hypothetical protein